MLSSKIQSGLEKPTSTKREKDLDSTKVAPDSVFIINKEPGMQVAGDALTIIGTHKEITLRARGDSIPNAVSVANIINKSMLKGNSKIHQITVSSEPIQELGQVLSKIEIIIRKI